MEDKVVEFGDALSEEALLRLGFDIGVTKATKVRVGSVYEGPCSIKTTIVDIRRIGAFSYINGRGRFSNVEIGRYCSIAESVAVGYPEHPTNWLGSSSLFYMKPRWSRALGDWAVISHCPSSATKIAHDVWIGAGAFIRAGINIGTGAIIGAHAVVTRDVPPYSIVVGNPGRVIKYRFDDASLRKALEASRWWEFSPTQLDGCPFNRPSDALNFIESLRKANVKPFEAPAIIVAEGGAALLNVRERT
jgi:acetyltransferase-like isoleucine patch superfamily enzyme